MAGVGLTSYNAFDDMVTDALVEYLDEKAAESGTVRLPPSRGS